MDYNKLISELATQYEKETIIILKGFPEEVWYGLNQDKLFQIDLQEYYFNNENLEKELLTLMNRKLSDSKVYYVLFEEILLIEKNNFNFFKAIGYKFVLINNNLFHHYYPLNDSLNDSSLISRIESESNNYLIQRVYSESIKIGQNHYISYSDDVLDLIQESIDIFESIDVEFEESDSDKATIDYKIDDRQDIFTSIVNEIITSGKKEIYLSHLDGIAVSQRRVLNIIKCYFDVNIILIKQTTDFSYQSNPQYLDILRRRNQSYAFKSIAMYKHPGETLETTLINQEVIIDRIVQNVIRSKSNQKYNDVFVTAPTGSGKSIIFQIPAIYLAEKYSFLTIIISPLIGLMNDQVNNIQDLTDVAATINSEYTPDQKDMIKERIRNKETSILYISPEALLANADITALIGDRDIGLIVIDEAHIVATWGKSFRPDYWYLGDYVNYLRTKKDYTFPITTFSATVTYAGDEDMHADIIDSLKMRTGNDEFIGPVRRDDISFDIRKHEVKEEYRKEKEEKVKSSLCELNKLNTKTISYFPFISQIKSIDRLLNGRVKTIGQYFGSLDKDTKNDNFLKFKNNEFSLMLCTKAFGMGIDIDDIQVVYHYAPTGNLMDYVQEIGRAARSSEISGRAIIDYFKNDFTFTKQLTGMSAINNNHVLGTLRKLRNVYYVKKNRNFMISPDDFAYIFNALDLDKSDAMLKTTLLMIQKDFELNPQINYKPIIFKPRTLFTHGYILIKDEDLRKFSRSRFWKYFEIHEDKEDFKNKNTRVTTRSYYDPSLKKVVNDTSTLVESVVREGDIYKVNYKSMWEENYTNLSFGQFKRAFFVGELDDFKISNVVIPEYLVKVNTVTIFEDVITNVVEFLNKFIENFDVNNKTSKSTFRVADISNVVSKINKTKESASETVALNLIKTINEFAPSTNVIIKYNQNYQNYSIDSYSSLKEAVRKMIYKLKHFFRFDLYKPKCTFLIPFDKTKSGLISITNKGSLQKMQLIQLMESLGHVRYEVLSGERPEYFIRINSIHQIEKILDDKFYRSKMVEKAKSRHENDVKTQQYFFTNLETDKERWDFIENYFVGMNETEAQDKE